MSRNPRAPRPTEPHVDPSIRERQLRRRAEVAQARADELQGKAVLAIERGNVKLARKILGERVEYLKRWEALCEELAELQSPRTASA